MAKSGKSYTFIISVILAAVAVASYFLKIEFVSENRFWFAIAAYALLLFR